MTIEMAEIIKNGGLLIFNSPPDFLKSGRKRKKTEDHFRFGFFRLLGLALAKNAVFPCVAALWLLCRCFSLFNNDGSGFRRIAIDYTSTFSPKFSTENDTMGSPTP